MVFKGYGPEEQDRDRKNDYCKGCDGWKNIPRLDIVEGEAWHDIRQILFLTTKERRKYPKFLRCTKKEQDDAEEYAISDL